MTVSNLTPGAPGGKGNPLPFDIKDFGLNSEHVGAVYRAIKAELKSVRTADHHGSVRSADKYMLGYDLISVLADVVSTNDVGFDASDHEVTQEHLNAVKWFADKEADRVVNSWADGGSRSPADRDRLGDVVEFVRAVVEGERSL